MVWVGRAVEIRQVAGGAGRTVQAVISIDVALRTLQRDMRPGQGKPGRCVIKGCIRPGHSRVARVASLRESRLCMVGVSRALKILQVAGRARTAGQTVVPVYVTLCTLQVGVRSGESESRGRVVEDCICPGRGVMAALASLRYSGLHMVGIGRALKVLQVTRHAGGIGQVVISVDVTLGALQRGVRPGQWEAGSRVIEAGISPGRGVVTALASLRYSRLHVVGIGRALKVLQVTRHAAGIGQVVISVDVTLGALQRDVRPG